MDSFKSACNTSGNMLDKAMKTLGNSKDTLIQKFAMGGVAKIRHDEATPDGMPKSQRKKK